MYIELENAIQLANGIATHAVFKGITHCDQLMYDLYSIENGEYVLLSSDACYWETDSPVVEAFASENQ